MITTRFKQTALLLLLALTSCVRQELEYRLDLTARIPVSIDWLTLAQLNPDQDPDQDVYSASVWLFPKPGGDYQGAPLEFRFNNPRGGEIEVPIGKYAVLVFNNSPTDYNPDRVGFRGTNKYETFEYFVKPQNGSGYYFQPEILAAFHLDDFDVTPEMVSYTRTDTRQTPGTRTSTASAVVTRSLSALTDVKPMRLTRTTFVQLNVQGLQNAASATGYFRGVASSVFLATGRTTNAPVGHYFPLNHRQYYPGQERNGTIEATYTTLGLLPLAASYTFDFLFRLHAEHDGNTLYPTPPLAPFRRDISSALSLWNTQLHVNINLGLDIPLDPLIILPDVSVSGDGGFGVDIDEWGPEVVIPM